MTRTRNLEIARLWYEVMWSKPEPEIADSIIDPAYKPDWVSIDASGPEQVKIEIRYFRSVFPDLVYEIKDLSAEKEKVWIRYLATGTQQNSAWGFQANGKQVSFEGAAILYTNAEGKVIDRWGAFCFYDLLADLGHVPTLWELSNHLDDYP